MKCWYFITCSHFGQLLPGIGHWSAEMKSKPDAPGVEEAMGVENSGVLYALWSYPAQASDELSFREGDMVTILQKPEGSDWWWASLCGREGFVPNNYFGVRCTNESWNYLNICWSQNKPWRFFSQLFPKVRPKTLCWVDKPPRWWFSSQARRTTALWVLLPGVTVVLISV